MINAEKLLGQVLGGVLGKGHGKHGKGKNKLMHELTSGAGLMTAIGLAVGAYEVLKDKKAGSGTAAPGAMAPPPPPSPSPGQPGGGPAAVPPPVPPPQWTAAPPVAPVVAAPASAAAADDMARRMIQVMVAAAHADGAMDEQEEAAILDQLRAADLSQEERMFLLDELHHPRDVASLVAGISDPSTAKAMYMLAFSAIEVDTEAERKWLDELAAGLGLSPAVRAFIEEQNR